MKELYGNITGNSNTVTQTNTLTTSVSTSVSTSTTIWKGGWVTDNWSTYYLDENMNRHTKEPKT